MRSYSRGSTGLPHSQLPCILHLVALRSGNWFRSYRQKNEAPGSYAGFISVTVLQTQKYSLVLSPAEELHGTALSLPVGRMGSGFELAYETGGLKRGPPVSPRSALCWHRQQLCSVPVVN